MNWRQYSIVTCLHTKWDLFQICLNIVSVRLNGCPSPAHMQRAVNWLTKCYLLLSQSVFYKESPNETLAAVFYNTNYCFIAWCCFRYVMTFVILCIFTILLFFWLHRFLYQLNVIISEINVWWFFGMCGWFGGLVYQHYSIPCGVFLGWGCMRSLGLEITAKDP